MRCLFFLLLLFAFVQSHAQKTADDVKKEFGYFSERSYVAKSIGILPADSLLQHPLRKAIVRSVHPGKPGSIQSSITLYNPKGRPVAYRSFENDKETGSYRHFYAAGGNLDSMVRYAHDTAYTHTSLFYDSNGRIIQNLYKDIYGSVADTRYTYDAHDHLIRWNNTNQNQETTVAMTYTGDLFSEYIFTVKNRDLEETDTSHVELFRYDSAGRMVGYRSERYDIGPFPKVITMSFAYDSSDYLTHQQTIFWDLETDTTYAFFISSREEYTALHPHAVHTRTDTFNTTFDTLRRPYLLQQVLTRNKKGQIIRETHSTIQHHQTTLVKDIRWKYDRKGRQRKISVLSLNYIVWSLDYPFPASQYPYNGCDIHRYDRHGNEKKYRRLDRHGNLELMTKTRYWYY